MSGFPLHFSLLIYLDIVSEEILLCYFEKKQIFRGIQFWNFYVSFLYVYLPLVK